MSAGENWEGGEPKSNTGKILLIIGLVGCGGLLLLVAVCAGLGWWGYQKVTKEAPAAQAAAEAFLDDVKANHVDAAYGRLSKKYRETMTKPAFDNLIKAFPILTTYTSRSVPFAMAFPANEGGAGSIVMQLTGPKGHNVCTLTMVKEQGEWKVQNVQVQ